MTVEQPIQWETPDPIKSPEAFLSWIMRSEVKEMRKEDYLEQRANMLVD